MKNLILLGIVFFASVLTANAEVIDPTIGHGGDSNQGNGKPRTSQPIFEVGSSGDSLVLDVSHYLGEVEVQILSQGINYSTYIIGYGRLTIDASSYSLGMHYFTLTLSDGTTYEGTFEKI